MATGGLTKGKSHKEGGIPMKVKNTGQNIEVEGGEIIINKKNVADTKKHTFDGKELTKCEIASEINSANGNGVEIDCDSVEGKKYKYKKGGKISDRDKIPNDIVVNNLSEDDNEKTILVEVGIDDRFITRDEYNRLKNILLKYKASGYFLNYTKQDKRMLRDDIHINLLPNKNEKNLNDLVDDLNDKFDEWSYIEIYRPNYKKGGTIMSSKIKSKVFDENGKRKIDDKSIEELTTYINSLPQTKSKHFNNTTKRYSQKRRELHKEIINSFIDDVVCIQQDEPIAILMGGSPASGKSSFLKKYAPYLLKEDLLRIDADEVRSMLPEYEGWNASQTHLETKDIVETLLSDRTIGIPCEFDLIYDGTMNNTKSYKPLIALLKKLGYKIFAVYIDNVPYEVIKKRALERYQKSGRFVPMEVIDDFFAKGKKALNKIKEQVDGYMIIDGSNRDYEIIEKGGMQLPKTRKYSKLGYPISEHFNTDFPAVVENQNIKYGEFYAKGGLTQSKAKKILEDGVANGKPLTKKQKVYMNLIAKGGMSKFAKGGYTRKQIDEIDKKYGSNSDEYSSITLPKDFNWKKADRIYMNDPYVLTEQGNDWLDDNGYDVKIYGIAANPKYGKNSKLLKKVFAVDDESYFQLLYLYQRTAETNKLDKEFDENNYYNIKYAKGGDIKFLNETAQALETGSKIHKKQSEQLLGASNSHTKQSKELRRIAKDLNKKEYEKGGRVISGVDLLKLRKEYPNIRMRVDDDFISVFEDFPIHSRTGDSIADYYNGYGININGVNDKISHRLSKYYNGIEKEFDNFLKRNGYYAEWDNPKHLKIYKLGLRFDGKPYNEREHKEMVRKWLMSQERGYIDEIADNFYLTPNDLGDNLFFKTDEQYERASKRELVDILINKGYSGMDEASSIYEYYIKDKIVFPEEKVDYYAKGGEIANAGMLLAGQVLSDPNARKDLIELSRNMQQMRQTYEEGGRITGNDIEKLIPYYQLQALKQGEREIASGKREEPLFLDSLNEAYKLVPKIYAQDGKGMNAVAYFHYFYGGSDWYITELDKKTNEAFGYAILNGDTQMSELTYISIPELTDKSLGNAFNNMNIDQYFSPKTLNQIFQSKYPELVRGEVEIYEDKKEVEVVETSDYLSMEFKNPYERNIVIRGLIDEKGSDPDNYTIDEKEFIGLYSGMGGLEKFGASEGLLFEYYTPKDIVEKMWGLAFKHKLGTMQIRYVLEPSVATGNFVGYAPKDVYITGYDIDKYAWSICNILYVKEEELEDGTFDYRHEFYNSSFEKQFFTRKNTSVGSNVKPIYDLVIGNPPYGNYTGMYAGMGEKKHTGATDFIDYFIYRSLDLLKTGGLLVFIIGKLTQLGGKRWTDQMKTPNKAQKYIKENSDLVDAYRLPVGIFDTTDVESEIIVLRKK